MKTVRLADVAQVNPRGEKPADDETVSFVPMADLDETTARTGRGSTRQFREVSKGYTVFRDRDLLVAKITPCFENNKIGQAHLARPTGVGSTEFHVVRPDPQVADARYLLHYLRQDRIRVQGEKRMTGSAGQRRVPTAFLTELKIPLPSLGEQRRIAAILDQADALRAKRRRILDLVRHLEQSAFVDLFGEPVGNSRGLPLVPLAELGRLDRGVSKHRPRNAPELLGGAYPLIQTGDVANSAGYIRGFSSTYSELGLAQSKLWPAGTLCITIAANIAKTGILTFDACFPDSVVGFTADRQMTTYIRVWLAFLQKTLEASAPQSAQKNINLAVLRGLLVPVPDRHLLDKFSDVIDKVDRVANSARNASVMTDELMSTSQARAFGANDRDDGGGTM